MIWTNFKKMIWTNFSQPAFSPAGLNFNSKHIQKRENQIHTIERSSVQKNTIKRSSFSKIILKGCSVIDFYHFREFNINTCYLTPPSPYDTLVPLVIPNLQQAWKEGAACTDGGMNLTPPNRSKQGGAEILGLVVQVLRMKRRKQEVAQAYITASC